MQKRRLIGLLGGSFNPAHRGHLHLSREALKRLGLDEVWWLVSPRNPLKKPHELAAYGQRLAMAEQVAGAEKRIRVTDMEHRLGSLYTVDTLHILHKRYPDVRFVWLMGADNLAIFHKWKQWDEIFRLVPVAVFDRAPYSHHSLRSCSAVRYAQARHSPGCISRLSAAQLPGWAYIHMRRDPTSATALRKHLEK